MEMFTLLPMQDCLSTTGRVVVVPGTTSTLSGTGTRGGTWYQVPLRGSTQNKFNSHMRCLNKVVVLIPTGRETDYQRTQFDIIQSYYIEWMVLFNFQYFDMSVYQFAFTYYQQTTRLCKYTTLVPGSKHTGTLSPKKNQ